MEHAVAAFSLPLLLVFLSVIITVIETRSPLYRVSVNKYLEAFDVDKIFSRR